MTHSILTGVSGPRKTELRLVEHVARIGEEHPPIDLGTVDFTVRNPRLLGKRFGHVLDYMARVELEVDRNVLELIAMLPDPPADGPALLRRRLAAAGDPARPDPRRAPGPARSRARRADLDHVSAKIRILGALAHVEPIQDVVRMLYYLTGMATERSAVLAYNLLHDGVSELGETAVAETIVAQIRRQEPAHYAFYKMSARGSGRAAVRLAAVAGPAHAPDLLRPGRRQQRRSRRPTSATLVTALGIDRNLETFAIQISRVERELLWARDRGLRVPDYVVRAFREAVELAGPRPRRSLSDQPRSTRAAIQAMSSAVSAGDADGCMTWLSTTRTTMSIAASRWAASSLDVVRRHPLGDHQLGRGEQRLGVGGQQRQQLGVGAVGGGDDRVQQPVVLGQLEHGARRRADRGDQVVGVPVEGGADDLRGSGRARAGSSPRPAPAWCRSRCRRSAG